MSTAPVPVDTPVRRRQATPERWHRALERARLAGVQVRQLQGSGQWFATSGSDPAAAYETDGHDCTCPAAMLGGDPVCLHRAAFRFMQGLFDPEPDPEALCRTCGGSGSELIWIPDYRSGGTICTGAVRCTSCDGSGVEPVAAVERLAA